MRALPRLGIYLVALSVLASGFGEAAAKKGKKNSEVDDPYAEYVWPPPPDEARIKLEAVISGRADVVTASKLKRKLLKGSPQTAYDSLRKPFAVDYDPDGRILVTDSQTAAVIRFDREGQRMDVLGTQGAVRLKLPLGLHVARDGTIYVADVGLKQVVAYDPEGKLAAVYGRHGELVNPTDAALSSDGSRLYVADSKAQQIVVFDHDNGEVVSRFGKRGEGEGEFGWPTSLAVGPEGQLFVVDQINCRVQVFDPDGEYVDQFGQRGPGFGSFVRPKDIAVDGAGVIYVTDNAFNNVQLFDVDFSLLTFVGERGAGPGRFFGTSGVAVRGDEFAVVDQLGRRLQIFRLLAAKDD